MKEKKQKNVSIQKPAKAECNDRDCPIHGNLKTRGRIFQGVITKKLNRRIRIDFEKMVYFKKYERYAKMKRKIHARLPKCMEKEINIGDIVQIQECRPLSKIIHFVVIKKIKSKDKKEK